jgi:hypothetical protein
MDLRVMALFITIGKVSPVEYVAAWAIRIYVSLACPIAAVMVVSVADHWSVFVVKVVSDGVYFAHTSTCLVFAALAVKRLLAAVPSPADEVGVTVGVPAAVIVILQSISVAEIQWYEPGTTETPELKANVVVQAAVVPVKLVPVTSAHIVSPILPAVGYT